MRTSFGKKRYLRCTNADPTKSGGRQPAVGWIAPRGQCTANYVPPITTVEPRAAGVSPLWYGNAIAAVFVHRPPTGRLCATIAIQPLRACFQNHGGLTPPALVLRCERLSAKNDICDAQTHIRLRAAGVSPPWFGFALATRIGFCGLITFRPAHSLRVPRLAHASRSWVRARLFLQKCDSRQRVASRRHGWLTPAAPGCTHACFCRTAMPVSESLLVPRLAYASRSWVHASLFLQNCDARQRVASRTTAGLRQRLPGQQPVPVIDDYSAVIVRVAHAVD